MQESDSIPGATVARLPVYLRALLEADERAETTVSSDQLAERCGFKATQVRKDISYLGNFGIRGVGYDIPLMIHQIQRELGLTQDWAVVIVGFGNLGHALANYGGFTARGFQVAAIFDNDETKVGEKVHGVKVAHIDDLKDVCRKKDIAIAIIATPAAQAQDVADKLVDAGVTSILNFAPATISVPPGTSIRKVDLSMELQILTFYQKRR